MGNRANRATRPVPPVSLSPLRWFPPPNSAEAVRFSRRRVELVAPTLDSPCRHRPFGSEPVRNPAPKIPQHASEGFRMGWQYHRTLRRLYSSSSASLTTAAR